MQLATELDVTLDSAIHNIVGDRKVKPADDVKPWCPVSRAEVRQWCLVQGQADMDKIIPAKPTDITPRRRLPWYLRTPKNQWRWLIRPLQYARKRWSDLFLGSLCAGMVFSVCYATAVLWLG